MSALNPPLILSPHWSLLMCEHQSEREDVGYTETRKENNETEKNDLLSEIASTIFDLDHLKN